MINMTVLFAVLGLIASILLIVTVIISEKAANQLNVQIVYWRNQTSSFCNMTNDAIKIINYMGNYSFLYFDCPKIMGLK